MAQGRYNRAWSRRHGDEVHQMLAQHLTAMLTAAVVGNAVFVYRSWCRQTRQFWSYVRYIDDRVMHSHLPITCVDAAVKLAQQNHVG